MIFRGIQRRNQGFLQISASVIAALLVGQIFLSVISQLHPRFGKLMSIMSVNRWLVPESLSSTSDTEVQQASTNSYQQCYGPLNERQLAANFERLKALLSDTVGPYLMNPPSASSSPVATVESLMRQKVPAVNCSGWRFQSPSGRRVYSRQELLDIARAEDSVNQQDEELEASSAIPNVAHFVLPFADPRLRFHHLVCVLSCAWLMRPRLLFLWQAANRPPVGINWRRLRDNLTEAGLWESRVVLALREVPRRVYAGVRVLLPEHQADVMRLEAVLAFGGAYFDLDVMTLRRLEPLRRFDFVIGRQTAAGLCNGAFLAAPGNQLVAMWHLAYQTFSDRWWALHSVVLPHQLCTHAAKGFPELCHIEPDSMHRPSWTARELPWIYGRRRVWNWRARNYMVHLWYRSHNREYNFSSILSVNSMLGDMFRFVLFGTEPVR